MDAARLERYVKSSRSRFEALLGRWVEIPSVSMDPRHKSDVLQAADAAVATLRGMGAQARRVETPGFPVVFGRFQVDARCPTVTVYNHLDVQPAQEPEWVREPFKFSVQGDRFLGRGATDDKGPAVTALLAARYAAENGVRLNVQFIWELEEEIGSPNFEAFLKKAKKDIRTDSVLVSDTIWIAKRRPAIPYGLRGMLAARLRLETAKREVHSGLTGGAARNPVGELCQVLAACHDARSGRVKIPGFYRDAVSPGREEIRGFGRSGFTVPSFKKAHGLTALRTRSPSQTMRRVWAEPTFEVHGISGGYQGPGVKTAIAPRAEAKISMRLVPGQAPRRILALLRAHVGKLNPDVKIIPEGYLRPYLGDVRGPHVRAARRAFRFAFGREPALVREGGSIGAVVGMEKAFKVPIVFMGLSLPEHGYHAPNEYFDWGQAAGGIKAFVKYFSELQSLQSPSSR